MPSEDTTKNTIIKIKGWDYDKSLDDYLTDACMLKTMGEIVKARESSQNAKAYTLAQIIYNAVFEMDVDLIRTIALRIDGTIPEEHRRDGYANIMGDAIEDVLAYSKEEAMEIHEYDTPLIAMAKALVYVGTQPCGTNYAKRKERNLAAQMILERCGGRKVEPTRVEAQIEYVEPEWMQLGQGLENTDEKEEDQEEQLREDRRENGERDG